MSTTGLFSPFLSAPRLFCRSCASRSSHLSQPRSHSFSTTIWRPRKGGLAGLQRKKGTNDRSNQFALPSTPARTRFAPSPTGYLHLGSLRTALYNYLLAKATGGKFIIRVEDTDRLRIVGDAEKRLYDDLRWANLEWDEGPDIGGPYGPYRQSERLDKYRPYANQLLESGHAYRCFCTAEDLERHKEHATARNQSTRYPGTCRGVAPDESADRAARGEAHIVRFMGGGAPSFVDRVYGRYEKKEEEDDFILVKSDGFPTYHFANVVDDHLMDITHVIRGAEWLISTPKHIALYDALGWDAPDFSHVGLLVDAAGQKLSKRNHDIDVASYRRRGILPSALNNWLVLLGWGMPPGSGKNAEMFTEMEDLVSKFSFKFTKGNIKVNPQKLETFQHRHAEYLLSNPDANLPVLRSSLLQPTASFIAKLDKLRLDAAAAVSSPSSSSEEIKSSSGRLFDVSQHGDLVPQLATAMTAEDPAGHEYLLRVFCENTTRYPLPTDLVLENPQLIWAVPAAVFRRNAAALASKERTLDILTGLRTRLAGLSATPGAPSGWDKNSLQAAISELVARLAAEHASPEDARDAVYEALRFALMGDPHLPSKPASMVMYLLGPAEVSTRISCAIEALE